MKINLFILQSDLCLILQVSKLQCLIAREITQFKIMLHPRFKLINEPKIITIDKNSVSESDIDDSARQPILDKSLISHNAKKNNPSLLSGTNLKKRRAEQTLSQSLKRQAVLISDQDYNQDDESLVFIKKITNQQCLKKKLKRLATVPNKVKLQRRDQNIVQCSICLTDLKGIEQKKIGRLACKHIFCYTCILQSSKFSNKCPYCRAVFNQIRYGKRSIIVPEARLNEQFDDPMDEPCYVCGRNDDFQRLLECQYCQYAYCHTYCDVRLNSDLPPAQQWVCLSCEQLLRNQRYQEQIYESDQQM